MATLNGGITSMSELIRISGTPPAPGTFITIDDEAMKVNGAARGADGRSFTRDYLSVDRGVAGTTKATHSNGATLTPYYPDAPGGGSGGVTVDNGSDPPAAVTRLVAPGADVSMPGTATLTQIVISTQDPGAIGAGNIWLNPDAAPGTGSDAVMLLVRDEADSEWYAVTGPSVIDPDGSSTLLIDGGDTTEIVYDGSRISLEAIGAKTPRIRLSGAFGLDIRDGEGNSGAPGQVLTVNADGSARWADLP